MGDMQRRKPRYHHGDLRNALVAQAARLVETGGAENFSLREAARLEGVSAKAAYRHFADRSDLLAAALAAGMFSSVDFEGRLGIPGGENV